MSVKRHFNRRRHERFRLCPMYTSVIVRRPGEDQERCGHAYDISESGVRIELDEPLEVGESVQLDLKLPGSTATDLTVPAEVVWVHDADDDPGPRRMALRFKAFASLTDRDRLLDYLGCGLYSMAA